MAVRTYADGPVSVVTESEANLYQSGVSASERGWVARVTTTSRVLWQVFTVGTPPVARTGNTIMVDGATFTITSAGVEGP